MLSKRQLAAINLKKRGAYNYALSMREKRLIARDPLKDSVPIELRLGMVADSESDEEMISDKLPKSMRAIARKLYAPSRFRSRSKKLDIIYEMADNAGWSPGDTTKFLSSGTLQDYLFKKKEKKKRGGVLKQEDLIVSQFLKGLKPQVRDVETIKRVDNCEDCGGTLRWLGGEKVCTKCGLVAEDMPLAQGTAGKEVQIYSD